MEKVFAVIGLGSFGRQLCTTITENGGKVIAVDNDPVLVDQMNEIVTKAVILDSTDENALSALLTDEVDIAIVAIGDNVEANILTTAILKQISVPYVISRSVTDLHQKVLRQIGANEVINLEIGGGMRLGKRLIAPQLLERVSFSPEHSLSEIMLPSVFFGKQVSDLQISTKFSLNLIYVKRIKLDIDEVGNPEKEISIIIPEDSVSLQENDILIVAGRNRDIEDFIKASE